MKRGFNVFWATARACAPGASERELRSCFRSIPNQHVPCGEPESSLHTKSLRKRERKTYLLSGWIGSEPFASADRLLGPKVDPPSLSLLLLSFELQTLHRMGMGSDVIHSRRCNSWRTGSSPRLRPSAGMSVVGTQRTARGRGATVIQIRSISSIASLPEWPFSMAWKAIMLSVVHTPP
jgi:hypothetical protein